VKPDRILQKVAVIMFKAVFTNSSGILFSRVTGLFRDLLMASTVGVNIFSDIFFIAFKLPNLFRRIFGEGAFSQAFIPSFTRVKNRFIFASSTFTQLLFIVLLLTIFVNIFPEAVTKSIALGYSEETVEKASTFVAINFTYLILIFSVTFLSALLHYREHFVTTAYSTALLNLSLIGAMILSADLSEEEMVYYLSYGVVIGGILQLLSHIFALWYIRSLKPLLLGFRKWREWSGGKSDRAIFYKKFSLGIWSNSTAQISAFIDTWLATFLSTGAVSYLYYGNRIFQLPLALFAIATTTAIFPKVSKLVKVGDEVGAKKLLQKGFWFLLYMLSVSGVIGVIFSEEIVWLLFERGEFTSSDRDVTAGVLSIYLIGLVSYGVSKLFSLWLYANEKMRESAKIATISLSSNILFSLLLIYPFGIEGLAMASTLSSFVLLIFTLHSFGWNSFWDILKSKHLLYLPLLLMATVTIGIGLDQF
jgi:putative peptidoglycan lipid II flippase